MGRKWARFAGRGKGSRRPRLLLVRDPELVDAKLPTCSEEEVEGYVWDVRDGRRRGERAMDMHDHGMDCGRYLVGYLDVVMGKRARGQGLEFAVEARRGENKAGAEAAEAMLSQVERYAGDGEGGGDTGRGSVSRHQHGDDVEGRKAPLQRHDQQVHQERCQEQGRRHQ